MPLLLSAAATWLLDSILGNIAIAITVWTVLYCLDYTFTIITARLYRDGAQQHFAFPEGLELTPYFRDDVANLRKISFRFFLQVLFGAGLLLVVYALNVPEIFAAVWGVFVGIQLAIHYRHVHNLVAFSLARRSAGVSGNLRYEHWASLLMSAVDLFVFGLLFLILFLFWGHMFALGAALGCLWLGLQHLFYSVKKRKSTQSA